MENEKIYIILEGYDDLERHVRASGRSGGVIVPKIWLGGNVKIILLDENDYKAKQGKQKKRIEIPTKKKLYSLHGYETITKTVKTAGRGASVLIPKMWIGKPVKIILTKKP